MGRCEYCGSAVLFGGRGPTNRVWDVATGKERAPLDGHKEWTGGIAFSPGVSARDWTDEKLAAIRSFYARFTETGAGSAVNLQGIKFDTKDGGVLPLERYINATLAEGDSMQVGRKSIPDVARERNLNAKYLGILWTALNDPTTSLLLDQVRAQWRAAKPGETAPMLATIRQWQQALWVFTTVGHIGKRDTRAA